jgi:hypothetical protein
MKVCPFCKRTLLEKDSICSSCGKTIQKTDNHNNPNGKKRGFKRVPFKGEVVFQFLSLDPQGRDLSLEGNLDNISLSGVCFDIDTKKLSHRLSYLKVSNLIWMKFSLPGKSEAFKCQGEIKRVRPFSDRFLRLGVMFINLDKPDYLLVNNLVNSSEPLDS